VDPFTIMAGASAAFSGIKKAVSMGKDIQSMAGTLGTWSKAVSDLDFLERKAQKPPLYKMFSDNQANALEIWEKKQKLKEYREELREYISFAYGPSAWKEIVEIEAKQRKQQQELVYQKQEFVDACISWAVGVFLFILVSGIGIGIIYYYGSIQGKW